VKIIWTKNAKNELYEIKIFWDKKTRSMKYSSGLYLQIKEKLVNISHFPEIGTRTSEKNIRKLIIDNYVIFYTIVNNEIYILKIWDNRRNPDDLNIIN